MGVLGFRDSMLSSDFLSQLGFPEDSKSSLISLLNHSEALRAQGLGQEVRVVCGKALPGGVPEECALESVRRAQRSVGHS